MFNQELVGRMPFFFVYLVISIGCAIVCVSNICCACIFQIEEPVAPTLIPRPAYFQMHSVCIYACSTLGTKCYCFGLIDCLCCSTGLAFSLVHVEVGWLNSYCSCCVKQTGDHFFHIGWWEEILGDTSERSSVSHFSLDPRPQQPQCRSFPVSHTGSNLPGLRMVSL